MKIVITFELGLNGGGHEVFRVVLSDPSTTRSATEKSATDALGGESWVPVNLEKSDISVDAIVMRALWQMTEHKVVCEMANAPDVKHINLGRVRGRVPSTR